MSQLFSAAPARAAHLTLVPSGQPQTHPPADLLGLDDNILGRVVQDTMRDDSAPVKWPETQLPEAVRHNLSRKGYKVPAMSNHFAAWVIRLAETAHAVNPRIFHREIRDGLRYFWGMSSTYH